MQENMTNVNKIDFYRTIKVMHLTDSINHVSRSAEGNDWFSF